jgi:hypothetical protein
MECEGVGATTGIEIDQNVDIALRVVFSAGDRAEDSHVAGVVPGGQAEDLVASPGSELLKSHASAIVARHEQGPLLAGELEAGEEQEAAGEQDKAGGFGDGVGGDLEVVPVGGSVGPLIGTGHAEADGVEGVVAGLAEDLLSVQGEGHRCAVEQVDGGCGQRKACCQVQGEGNGNGVHTPGHESCSYLLKLAAENPTPRKMAAESAATGENMDQRGTSTG